jgi:hypothetical protein
VALSKAPFRGFGNPLGSSTGVWLAGTDTQCQFASDGQEANDIADMTNFDNHKRNQVADGEPRQVGDYKADSS